jgi:ubiquinone/menaquinone biosynthesis C-methylase UbiE
MIDIKQHWENIYLTKELKDVSWYQLTPTTSIKFIEELQINKNAKIIDVGGGDSFLVDHLIKMGFNDITVLDISLASIDRAKLRLGDNASKIKWVVADSSNFQSFEQYDFWHDRASFHFHTNEKDINNYIENLNINLKPNGICVIGTFSEQGPKKCSGIDIKQYSEDSMEKTFQKYFQKINSITVDHQTPFNTIQNFIFCAFQKID